MSNTKSSMIDMKSKDAIKLDIVVVDKSEILNKSRQIYKST